MSTRSTTGRRPKSAKTVRENSMGWIIKTLATGLDAAMKEALAPLGLSLGQFAIVMTLLERDDITQTEIGHRISMPGYATTRNLDVLEENGLLRRRRHASSRRSHSIRLTAKGRALRPKLFAIIQQVNARLLSVLEEDESEELKELLRKLITGWRESTESNPHGN